MAKTHNIEMTEKGKGVCGKRTICEVHRQLYDTVVLNTGGKNQKKILPLIEEAYDLGIRLVEKLVEHNISLLKWERHTEEDMRRYTKLRKLRVQLQKKKKEGLSKAEENE